MKAVAVPGSVAKAEDLIAILNLPRNYRWQIRNFVRYCEERSLPLDAFSFRQAVDELREKVRSHQVSANSFNLYVASNRCMLIKMLQAKKASAIDLFAVNNLLKEPAMKIIRSKDESDILSVEDIDALKQFSTPRGKLIVELLQVTALRISEALSLSAKLKKKGSYYCGTVLGKGSRVREVYIPEGLFEKISAQFKGKHLLFETRNGKRLDRKGVLKALHLAANKAVVAGVAKPELIDKSRLHAFRHAWATRALNQGVDLQTVAAYLGHQNAQTAIDFYIKRRPSASAILNVYQNVA